jgi:hypothetical protein
VVRSRQAGGLWNPPQERRWLDGTTPESASKNVTVFEDGDGGKREHRGK